MVLKYLSKVGDVKGNSNMHKGNGRYLKLYLTSLPTATGYSTTFNKYIRLTL
jgi:hypothetical protein